MWRPSVVQQWVYLLAPLRSAAIHPFGLACPFVIVGLAPATIMLSLLLTPACSLCLSLWSEVIRSRRGYRSPIETFAIVKNCLSATALDGLSASCPLFWSLRLLLDVRVTTLVVPCEILGRGLPAEITVQALIADVDLSGDIVGHPLLERVE